MEVLDSERHRSDRVPLVRACFHGVAKMAEHRQNLAGTTDTNRERAKATPVAADLKNPKEVWKNGESVPSRDRSEKPRSGMIGRVADAGNIGDGTPSPYGTEVQSEVVVTQRPRGDINHPARTFADERREAENKLTDGEDSKD